MYRKPNKKGGEFMIYNFDYSLLYERMAEYRYSQSSL
ncbi:DNA-binding protein, partial [Staphylococcus aureus]|nr:DNA-binding protein [Staphylococcus aureus]